jgi:hypothetical protein
MENSTWHKYFSKPFKCFLFGTVHVANSMKASSVNALCLPSCHVASLAVCLTAAIVHWCLVGGGAIPYIMVMPYNSGAATPPRGGTGAGGAWYAAAMPPAIGWSTVQPAPGEAVQPAEGEVVQPAEGQAEQPVEVRAVQPAQGVAVQPAQGGATHEGAGTGPGEVFVAEAAALPDNVVEARQPVGGGCGQGVGVRKEVSREVSGPNRKKLKDQEMQFADGAFGAAAVMESAANGAPVAQQLSDEFGALRIPADGEPSEKEEQQKAQQQNDVQVL